MRLKDILKDVHEYSGKASDITRQLAFAGMAGIWIFKPPVPDGGQISIPTSLVIAGTMFISSLAIDLSQYVLAVILWKGFHRKKELSGLGSEEEVKLPAGYSSMLYRFFYLKIFASIAGFAFLLYYMCTLLL